MTRSTIHRRSVSQTPLQRVVIAVAVVLLAAQFPSRAVSQDVDGLGAALAIERTFQDVVERTEQSIVSIARIKTRQSIINPPTDGEPFGIDLSLIDDIDPNAPDNPDFVPTDFGSGILIAPTGNPDELFILTNYHVVKGGPPAGTPADDAQYKLYVRFANKRGCEASIIAGDPRSDLAVLRIDFAALHVQPSELKPIALGDGSHIRKGQLVLALGNPYAIGRDGSASVSWGMVSNITRRPAKPKANSPLDVQRYETIHHYGTLLQVDTRLNLGTSGGALVNLRGELIGITTSLAALDGYEKSAGFAIPLDAAMRRIIDSLVRGHEVEYGFLGLHPLDALAADLDLLPHKASQASAVVVSSVTENSPAQSIDLARGDLVLAINDQPILDHYDLFREVGSLGPDASARIRFWSRRNGREITRSVRLGKWPAINEEDIVATSPRYQPWRGVTIDYSSARDRYFDRFRYIRAVVVLKVDDAEQPAGLKPGDFITQVNEKPVTTPAEFYAAVDGLDDAVTLKLLDGREIPIGSN